VRLQQIDNRLKTSKPEGPRRWYVNGQGQTMVLLPQPGEFWMGEGQERHRRRINRSFALAAREVTVAEFLRFRKDHQYWKEGTQTTDCPVNQVSWYDAAAYCNWLSEQEGIARDQWCYVPRDKGQFDEGMKMAPDYLKRTGYRLPTEAEWEYACRAGAQTSWSHGEAEELLRKYAWYSFNASDRLHPVGGLLPNDWGFCDLHGNAWEWCHDRWKQNLANKVIDDVEDIEDIKLIKDARTNNKVMNSEECRVLRGGAFPIDGVGLRCAIRSDNPAGNRYANLGFRPARTYH
jgi:formylglycine-generating enzyme required for sulfatase activity